MILAIAPVGAWIAVKASIGIVPIILGMAVIFWVAGFDVIYSCQDIEFDKKFNLHSIPKRFGIERGLAISLLFHILMIAFLLCLLPFSELGAIFLLGVGIISILLVYEHSIIKPYNLEKIPLAFFHVNAFISLCFFIFVSIDILF
jgi:4-hydroxybenzoate polyprenyltransferase